MCEGKESGLSSCWLTILSYLIFVEISKRNAILKACRAVGSVSDSCFDIRFNPDVCSPGTEHPRAHIQILRVIYMYVYVVRLKMNCVSFLQVLDSLLSV